MTDFQQVMLWLNQFDRSHLTLQTEPRLKSAKDPRRPIKDRDQLLENAITAGGVSPDPLEYHELLVYCAEDHYSRDNWAVANGYLEKSIAAYHKQPGQAHRNAVTEWLLGCTDWRLGNNRQACNHWQEAREGFVNLVKESEKLGDKPRLDWYRQQALEMSAELACTAEQGYLWYTWVIKIDDEEFLKKKQVKFERFGRTVKSTYLREGLNIMRGKLAKSVEERNYPAANETIHKLLGVVKEQDKSHEVAEAYLECGLAKYELHEPGEAVRLLEIAVATFHPGTDRQSLTRWVLGAVQWTTPGLSSQAIKNWSVCIEDMLRLIDEANWKKDLYRLQWYKDTLAVMKLALSRKIGQ